MTDKTMKETIGREVSDDVKSTDSRFEVEFNRLIDDLSEPGILETIAIHEVGHEHYYLLAGVSASDIDFVPPVVLFDRANFVRPFDRQMAAIKIRRFVPDESDPDWYFKLAKGFVAGGECSVRFPQLRRRNDTADFKLWNRTCAEGYEEWTAAEVDKFAKEKWQEAQLLVRQELNDQALEGKIRRRAAEVMPLLFPWLNR